jgi:DNA modification methylase
LTEPLRHKLIHGDCLEVLRVLDEVACIFGDPPDNIGLRYNEFDDRRPDDAYVAWLDNCLRLFIQKAGIVWISYNAKWSFAMGMIVHDLLREHKWLQAKPCVQVYTFGQHNHHDLGNNHRPLLRLRRDDAPLYPDAIRVPSWRQQNGDRRADPRGRVPGDVFDFPRVTGTSKQRRRWHPTQLHEELVERCVKLSTLEGERVIDPFAGTGTTLRVCDRIGRPCTLIECDQGYCEHIASEHDLDPQGTNATVLL